MDLVDTYVGAVPADLVLVCRVFGNIGDGDVRCTIGVLLQLCSRRARVIWTRHGRDPDIPPRICEWFEAAGFCELARGSPGPDSWSVGLHEFGVSPRPLATGSELFTFVR